MSEDSTDPETPAEAVAEEERACPSEDGAVEVLEEVEVDIRPVSSL